MAVVGLGLQGGLWAKGKLERRQSRKLTAQANEYLREGKIEETRMGLEAALKLNPANAEALRLIARLQVAQGSNAEALSRDLPAFTNKRPVEEWGQLLGDIPAASAILDRLLHRSEIIVITGPSYRLHQSTAHHLATTAATPQKPQKSPA